MKGLDFLKSEVKKILEEEKDVLFSYFFGSQAGGPTHFKSDIDLAVYLKPGKMEYYLERDKSLLNRLISHLKTDRVDLKILNVLPLLFQFRIISSGELIVVKEEQARVDFETSVLYRYFEMKPFFEEYNYLVKEMIKRGG